MSQKNLRIFSVTFVIFFLMAFAFSYDTAQAGPRLQDATPKPCESCHSDIQHIWYEGAHSSARTDHVLEESMNCLACHPSFQGGQGANPPAGFASNADGKMEDAECVICHTTDYDPATGKSASYGVTCEACHTPVADHPDNDIATDTDTELCGKCHSDSRFNWDNWQNSRHYRENMSCVECHDPHSTSLHNVAEGALADKSALCLSCHEPDERLSPHSMHGRAGVSCVDCHLGEKRGADAFHVVPNHSFKPEIATCSNCHAEEIHRPAMPSADLPVAVDPRPKPTQLPEQSPESNQPDALPKQDDNQIWWLALTGVAGLIGLIIGVGLTLLRGFKKSR